MIVHVNGKPVNVPEKLTIEGLIRQRDLDPDTVVVEYNLAMVKRSDLAGIVIKENDRLEILRFVGGG